MKKKRVKKDKKVFNLKFYIGSILMIFSIIISFLFYFGFEAKEILDFSLYQNLANPSMRVVKVYPGLRTEEVARVFYKTLDWTEAEVAEFALANSATQTPPLEGKLLPKTYVMHKDASPKEVKEIMLSEFEKAFEKIKNKSKKKVVNEEIIIKIASIIQREASGKKDMALISGVIWNRFWLDMKLEMDSTLQYAKGSEEAGWWKTVSPKDKKIDSPYNTYLHKGFPPGAISNPSIDAINAAYNPQKTECLFYIHDKKKRIHCAKTYEEHKQNIDQYL